MYTNPGKHTRFWKLAGRTTYLYTKGKEYSLNGVEYVGYYYLNGNVPYTGYEPSAGSERLYPYNSNGSAMRFDKLKPEYIKLHSYVHPYYSPPVLTTQMYESGMMTRYFLKKRNENIIFEVSSAGAKKLGARNGFDDIMYQLTKMSWMISPNGITNELMAFNQNSLNKADKEMPGLRDRINTLYEYSVVDIIP